MVYQVCSARDYVQSYNTQSVVFISKFRNNILCKIFLCDIGFNTT